MKIHGPNQTHLHAYKRQIHQQLEPKKAIDNKDEIDISSAAQKLQKTNKNSENRAARVMNIKQAIQSGQYEVNIERTSERMIDFWSSRS